jgi:hypothetical protein
MTSDEVRQQLELRVVEMIKQKLIDGTMTEERSREVSQHVLECLKPGMTFVDLFKAMPKLDDGFSEMSPLIVPYLREYEANVVQKAREKAQDFIHEGKFDASVKLIHDAIDYNLNVQYQAEAKPPIQ